MKALVPVLLVSALATPLLALPLSAQVVGTADSIADALQDYGLKAESGTDSEGDPKIESRIEGIHFSIWFYGCEDAPCTSLEFRAGFDLDTPLSAATVNEWNRTKRFGKAWIDDEGDPFLEMLVPLGPDGLSDSGFELALDMWRVGASEFSSFIGW
ncbi:MAG TPA: YbjN domain-containing protein [Paracoccus solventivorans]|nr:YbjN domain-containing protein [Paracoccus solventivorans]